MVTRLSGSMDKELFEVKQIVVKFALSSALQVILQTVICFEFRYFTQCTSDRSHRADKLSTKLGRVCINKIFEPCFIVTADSRQQRQNH